MNCNFEIFDKTGDEYIFKCSICGYEHKKIGEKPPKKNCDLASLECSLRGDVIGLEDCESCKGKVKVKIFACAAFGKTSIRGYQKDNQPTMDCERCIANVRTRPRVIQPDCGVTAVTSIAPNGKALDAIQSWQDAGLLVVAIQPRDELEKVKAIYGELVDYWLPTDQDARWQFDKPLCFIWNLASVAVDTKKPVMLINSDIEIHGDNQTLVSLAEMARSRLVVGVRHNFHDWRQTSLERHGLDVFFVNPEFADSLPHLPLCMGKPLWDYWVPKHAQKIGQEIEIYEEPLFFHRKHDLQWSGEDWLKMTRILQDNGYDFGVTRYDDLRAAEQQAGFFRESLRLPLATVSV